jgi:hypothetical protein
MQVYVVLGKTKVNSLAEIFSQTTEVRGVFVEEDKAAFLAGKAPDAWYVPADFTPAVIVRDDPPDWWPKDGKWGGSDGWLMHLLHCRPDRCEIGCDCPHHEAVHLGAE